MVCFRRVVAAVLVDVDGGVEDCCVADGRGGDGESVWVESSLEGVTQNSGEGSEVVFELSGC